MEETKSGTRSGRTECMDDGGYEKPNPCPELVRVPDWRELSEELGETEDLIIDDGFMGGTEDLIIDDGFMGGTEDLIIADDFMGASTFLDETFLDSICVGAGAPTRRVAAPVEVVNSIMEALRDPNIHTIGVCSEEGGGVGSSLSLAIERRVERDNLFDLIMKCDLSESNLTEIQKGIARKLGFSIPNDEKSSGCMVFRRRNKQKEVVTGNAKLLSERIRAQPNILFILYDLGTTLDLAKLGIPIGVDHKGCKLILTTEKEEILSKMNVQRSYSV